MKRAALYAGTGLLLLSAVFLIGLGCSSDNATGPETGLPSVVNQALVGDVDYADGYPFGVWQDDFESYEAGTFPSTWIDDGNTAYSYVDGSMSYEGAQSLRLYGTPFGTWAGCAYRALEVEAPFEIRLAVYNGNENIGGPYPARAVIGLLAGTNWWDPERALMYFNHDGNIMVYSEVLGTYNTEQWYHVRIRYERLNDTEVKIRYWIDNQCIGARVLAASSHEGDFTHLELYVLEGSAWFDNVEICSRP